ncbi:MAG: toll/interleukin-1 receptor domain-containing protein [Acidobacteria bacterium]|nr:toll/interleukin-1 receptor domain-containing protein [Acidobacteriota bacterium]
MTPDGDTTSTLPLTTLDVPMVGETAIDAKRDTSSVSVYLSYAHEDERDIEFIRDTLLEAGIEVRPTSPIPGSSWAQHYRQELLSADAVLVILTEHYRIASFVFAELAEAIDAHKRMIPILISKAADVPAVLGPYQSLDLMDPESRQERLKGLISRLKKGSLGKQIDPGEELEKIKAQESLLRREEKEQNQRIDVLEEREESALATATGAAAAIASGATIGSLAGPVGTILGGVFGGAIAAYYRRHLSSDKFRSKRQG